MSEMPATSEYPAWWGESEWKLATITRDADITALEAEKAHLAVCYNDMEEAKRLVSVERDAALRADKACWKRAEQAEATVERLKVGGNCAHWWAGLLGCEMDPDQEVVCEGRDHCKVFNQVVGGPREPCWAERGTP